MLESIKNYFANFDGTTNICRTIALWVAVALAVAFAVSKIFVAVYAKKSGKTAESIADASAMLNRAWLAAALVFAAALIVTFAACYFTEVANGEDDLFPILFYPLLALAVAAVACIAAIALKPTRLVKIISAAVCGGALVAVVACMSVHYASGEAGEAYSDVGLYISSVALIAGMIVLAIFADRRKTAFDTRTVAFAAVCVALSFALSYVRIFKLPMGGSITFASMLPLMLFAFMFGCRKGVLVGAVYGVLQAIQDPWIIHPAQFALDYLIAFAAIGLTGVMRDFGAFGKNVRAQFCVGACIACAARFVSHYFAGVFAFGMYGADFAEKFNMSALANPYFYSFVYQSMYLLPELAIVIAVGLVMFASKNFRRQIEIFSAVKPTPATETPRADAEQPTE